MFYAEVLRIARATSVYDYFIQAVQNLLIRMKKQGAVMNGINRSLTKRIILHSLNFTKYSKTTTLDKIYWPHCHLLVSCMLNPLPPSTMLSYDEKSVRIDSGTATPNLKTISAL